jgi:uncharacterized protein (UPF0332 family)
VPVTPCDFLASAREEISLGNEINFRNAISRSYYSSYHRAKSLDALIPDHPGIKNTGGAHEQFISKLTGCQPSVIKNNNKNITSAIKSIGYMLNQAKSARHKSDYDLDIAIDEQEALAQIALAEKINEKINEKILDVISLLSSNNDSQLTSS